MLQHLTEELWSERVTARRQVLNAMRKGWENSDYICPAGWYYVLGADGRDKACAIGAMKIGGFGQISGVPNNIEDKLHDLGLSPDRIICLSDEAGTKSKAIDDIVQYVWYVNGREARLAGLTLHQATGLSNSYLDPLGPIFQAFSRGYLDQQLETLQATAGEDA